MNKRKTKKYEIIRENEKGKKKKIIRYSCLFILICCRSAVNLIIQARNIEGLCSFHPSTPWTKSDFDLQCAAGKGF